LQRDFLRLTQLGTGGWDSATGFDGIGGPRFVTLPDGRGRLYCFASEYGEGGLATGSRISQSVISAVTSDGLHFDLEPGYRLNDRQMGHFGITAADVIVPKQNELWLMVYSGWQDVSSGTVVPPHPSSDPKAVESGLSDDFAAASIASDLAGYRSRIFATYSSDGLEWDRGECVIDGAGLGQEGIDAVHAEDKSIIRLSDGRYRIYYAACDKDGNFRIASAISAG
jgi:hypothetical protein